jgi:8-oxo-dGTP pyrophosphatase MutT (NUDIX family)
MKLTLRQKELTKKGSKQAMSQDVRRYRSAGGVVIDDAARVLLIERIVDGQHEVRLPKGHIEEEETADAAAVREVCEETGYCDLHIIADLGWRQVVFEYKGRLVIRDERYYLMALASERRRAPHFASEREALFRNRWAASFTDAALALTFEAERDAMQRAEAAHNQRAVQA